MGESYLRLKELRSCEGQARELGAELAIANGKFAKFSFQFAVAKQHRNQSLSCRYTRGLEKMMGHMVANPHDNPGTLDLGIFVPD